MDEWSEEFHHFLQERFPPDSKRGTSGVFYKEFGEKVKDAIKSPSTADKHLRFYIKKNQLKLLDLPSLSARNVLVVPLRFHIPKMRRHLFECLERQQMRHFPSNQYHYCQTAHRTENVPVYCKCRLQEEGNMIYCEGCDTWYHSTCDNIQKMAWAKDSTWLCSSCSH